MITNKDHPKSAKVRNQFYEADLEEDIGLIRCLMKSIGLWYSKTESSSREKFMSIVSVIACTLLNVAVVVPFFIHLVFIEEDIKMVVENASALIGFIIGGFKYLCMVGHRSDICNYIDRISEDWRNARMDPDRKIMLQSTKFFQQLIRTAMIIMYAGPVGYSFMLPILSGDLLSHNDTTRRPTFPCYYHVFDVYPSPNYEIVYITQISGVAVCTTFYVIASALTAKFVFHICTQCRIVRSLFEDVIDGDKQQDRSFNERWSYAIKAHLRVLRFVKDAVSVLRGICFAELLGCSTITCFIGLNAIWVGK
ncbi:uncharacterized protein LOC105697892 [Orussus abietinus]|uniref:uncharacterized protein LOC105697892 n=1 Tax=Orussus abietinus TaxID=222816 RepID=UPI000C71626B|nr:uncharacterized protein LOC105697892 [Orussus abietinus]